MSFPAYPEYKSSDAPWLGDIPKHWSLETLRGQFGELKDKNVGALDQNYLSLVAGRGVMPYAEKGEMGNKKPDDLEKCKMVKAGNFVINSMNFGIGAFGVSAHDGVCSPVYVVLEPSEPRSLRYLRWIFDNPGFREMAQSFGNGILAHRAAIGWDDLKLMKVGVPPIAEQVAIASFLDRETAKIDALVAEQERLIALLKEKRQAVISHAVTKGLDPDAPMKDSGIEWLGDIPAHWAVHNLKRYFAEVDYGISDSLDTEGAIAILRMGNIRGGQVLLDDLKYVTSVDQELLLREGDLLFNRTNSLDQIAKVGLVENLPDSPLSFASYLVRLRPTKHAHAKFLSFLTNTEGLLGVARSRAFVAIGQCNLNPTRYGKIDVCMPPLREQEAIVAYLEPICAELDRAINECEVVISLSRERRAALISAAVTGKIDVRGLVELHEMEAA